jgi:syndecan 2
MKIFAFILIHILIQTCKTEYVWTGTEWKWQEGDTVKQSNGGRGAVSEDVDSLEGTGDGDGSDYGYDGEYDPDDYEGNIYDENPNQNSRHDDTELDDEDIAEGSGTENQENVGSGGYVPDRSRNDPAPPGREKNIYVDDPFTPPEYEPEDREDDEVIFEEDVGVEHVPTPTTTTTTTTKKPPSSGTDNRSPINRSTSFFAQPGILAAVIGGAVVGLLCAILLVMFIVYRMRKKDEGSYALDEPKRSPNVNSYSKPPSREFYA